MSIFNLLHSLWILLFGWMPPFFAVGITVILALMVLILLIKFIAFILDAIPFL